jgi:hypothetical protein
MWKGSNVMTRSGDVISLGRAYDLIMHSDV